MRDGHGRPNAPPVTAPDLLGQWSNTAFDVEVTAWVVVAARWLRESTDTEAVWGDLLAQVAVAQRELAGYGPALAMVPRFSSLDALGLPDILQINDVHLGNVCGPAHSGDLAVRV